MEKETALALFEYFETATFAFVNSDADAERWVDEDTPPTDQFPVFDVRLDARIDSREERAYRLRVYPTDSGLLQEVGDAISDIAAQAVEHGVDITVQNSAFELT